MSTPKHTPAPWIATDDGYIHSSDSKMILKFARNTKQDAHLIAAAPEMLEALESIFKILQTSDDQYITQEEMTELYDIIAEALTKAKRGA